MRPLTPDEWAEAWRQAQLAELAVWKLGVGLQVTLPMAGCNPGFRVREKAGFRKHWIADRFEVEHQRLRPFRTNPDTDAPGPHHWFLATRGPGGRKRPLTCPEWAALGDLAKKARGHLAAVGAILREGFPDDPKRRPWDALASRMDGFMRKLNVEVRRQHPGWAEAGRVFSGPVLDVCRELAVSVDLHEFDAIGVMTPDLARRLAKGSPAAYLPVAG